MTSGAIAPIDTTAPCDAAPRLAGLVAIGGLSNRGRMGKRWAARQVEICNDH